MDDHRQVATTPPRKTPENIIYLLAAVAVSGFMLSGHMSKWPQILFLWLLFSAVPLFFVFAYPRFLFATSPLRTTRVRFAAAIHSFGFAAATFSFLHLAIPIGRNPLLSVDSPLPLFAPLIALPVFLIAALSVLLRKKSSLVTLASVLYWPYCLLATLVRLDRFFDETPLFAVFYFLCLISPCLFVFAAGSVSHQSKFARLLVILTAAGSAPWIYWTKMRNGVMENAWIMFNVPDRDRSLYSMAETRLAILSVGLITLAAAIAILRILPSNWKLRKLSVRQRSWPAFVVCFLVLAIWFIQSVVPYRIPGALDSSDSIVRILHVEKHGLQFRETSIRVWNGASTFSVTRKTRNLFRYGFEERGSSGELAEPLIARIRSLAQSPLYSSRKSETPKPLLAWNGDGWYFIVGGSGIRSFRTDKGETPPAEIVALFQEVDAAPHSAETRSEMRDVCLGFCYDPASGLGFLYSNHRCFYEGNSVVCR